MSTHMNTDLLEAIDQQRTNLGFHTVPELLSLVRAGNIILDPFSVLISTVVSIGSGNLLYPGVVIEARNGGQISIGHTNIFYGGTFILADQGRISIGSNNELGDGGISIKANVPGSAITIGDGGRYLSGVQIMGKCLLGSGSQILGAITVQNCTLGGGDSYQHPDPDARGAVLKGSGLARSLVLQRGDVLNNQTDLSRLQIERQAAYHPKK